MTADLDTHTAITALRRGAYDYFDKSRDPTSLFAVLDRCFDKAELQRQREQAYEALRIAKEEAEAANRAKSASSRRSATNCAPRSTRSSVFPR
jgi:DNA-binding NtrC family response regulator